MKLSQLKEEIKGIIRERGVAAIQKEYQKTIEEIEKALDFYKKNKNTDKKDAFVKVLKQLGEKKKALQNELDLKVQSMYRNAELKADESVNEDANPKFFPSGKKEWAKSATFFDADKVDILLITSKYKDVNDAYYIFKKDGRFIGSADSIKGGKPSGTKVNVKLSDVSNAKSIGDLKKMIGESVVNEISAIDGLTDVIDGKTSSIEGVKLSKDMAEHIMYWIRTSPYGKKYGTWFKRNGIAKLLPIAFMWGLDRYLPSNLKGELATLKSKYGKSKNESVNEAFQKGKTYGGTKCEGGCFIGKQGLLKIIKISKELPNNTFIFRDDNYSGLQPHFIKNGVIAKANTIGNPSYDLDRNKVRNLNIGKDVILSLRIAE